MSAKIITSSISIFTNWLIATGSIQIFVNMFGINPVLGMPQHIGPAVIAATSICLYILFIISPVGESWLIKRNLRNLYPDEKEKLLPLFHNVCIAGGEDPDKYVFRMIKGYQYNAYATGNKVIALGKAIDENFTEEEIKAILAHELAHHLNKDVAYKRIDYATRSISYLYIKLLYIISKFFSALAFIPIPFLNLFFKLISLVFDFYIFIVRKLIEWPVTIGYFFGSRQAEYAADAFAAKIGYKKGMIDALKRLKDISESQEDYQQKSYYQSLYDTHPDYYDRIEKLYDLS